MYYKTPGKMEKHRITDKLTRLLFQEAQEWSRKTPEERSRSARKRVKIFYNLAVGKFRIGWWKATPKKNEIVVIANFPSIYLLETYGFEKREVFEANASTIRSQCAWMVKTLLSSRFYEAALKLAPNAYRNAYMLAAERCLEIANKRRCEE